MPEPLRRGRASLYAHDFASWADEQGRILRTRNAAALDWENLAEEVESLGSRERNEIRNRLRVLLMHLLKWQFQPERRSHSWQSTIGEQRTHIAGIIEDSPSLKGHPGMILADSYAGARREAATETRLPLEAFPAECPYSAEQALDYGFMPGDPWTAEDLS
jgi:hypothetical protein